MVLAESTLVALGFQGCLLGLQRPHFRTRGLLMRFLIVVLARGIIRRVL